MQCNGMVYAWVNENASLQAHYHCLPTDFWGFMIGSGFVISFLYPFQLGNHVIEHDGVGCLTLSNMHESRKFSQRVSNSTLTGFSLCFLVDKRREHH